MSCLHSFSGFYVFSTASTKAACQHSAVGAVLVGFSAVVGVAIDGFSVVVRAAVDGFSSVSLVVPEDSVGTVVDSSAPDEIIKKS